MILATYSEEALKVVLAASPGTEQELSHQAQRVVERTQQNLSRPWPPPGEPGGPPRLRTGLLRESVKQRTVRDGDDVAVDVFADAQHRGWYYGDILRNGTYAPTGAPFVFITDQDLESLRSA